MNKFFVAIFGYNFLKIDRQLFVFIWLIFFIFLDSCTSQNIGFKKIEYASFKIVKSKSSKTDSVFISLYSIIDDKGLAKVIDDDDYHDTLKFYTQKVDKERLDKINTVFNRQKKLDTYFYTKKLGANEFYGGEYHLFLISYKDGQKDSLCFVEPFMSSEFNSLYKMLDNFVFYGEHTNPCSQFKIPENFRKAVLLNYKKSSYLPEIKTLPSFKTQDQ